MQALTAPVFRSVAVGALLLALGMSYQKTTHRHEHRLVLETVSSPRAIYLTAWDNGDVWIDTGARLRPITFETRASVSDGCRWLGIETLVPIDNHRYAYDYAERVLECDADADPEKRMVKTPRTGIVYVED